MLVNSLFFISGESGLGKSTLVNSLFLTDLYPERHIPTAQGIKYQVNEKSIFKKLNTLARLSSVNK